MNRRLVERFGHIERRLTDQYGPFTLFALFLRFDATRWDLVVAAPWAPGPTLENVRKIVEVLQEDLAPTERQRLSRVILLDPNERAVREFVEEYPVEHGLVEMGDRDFEGVSIDRGYVITARPRLAEAA